MLLNAINFDVLFCAQAVGAVDLREAGEGLARRSG
jgi:hypothetical protein